MDKVLSEVERAGENGDIDAALMLMQNVDNLDAAREKLLSTGRADPSADPNNKKLRVCDVCGSYLSVYDSDKRLADHFLGKQHIGYQRMRDTLEAIRKRRAERPPRTSEDGRGRDDRDRDRGRDERGSRQEDRYAYRPLTSMP